MYYRKPNFELRNKNHDCKKENSSFASTSQQSNDQRTTENNVLVNRYEYDERKNSRYVDPPEYDEEMELATQDILNHFKEEIQNSYTAPTQILDIALGVSRKEESRKRGRSNIYEYVERNKIKRHKYNWSPQQDQQIVAFALLSLYKGEDLASISPYSRMIQDSPLLANIGDARRLRFRLQYLCRDDRSHELGDYCGLNLARTAEERRSIENTISILKKSFSKNDDGRCVNLIDDSDEDCKIISHVRDNEHRNFPSNSVPVIKYIDKEVTK